MSDWRWRDNADFVHWQATEERRLREMAAKQGRLCAECGRVSDGGVLHWPWCSTVKRP